MAEKQTNAWAPAGVRKKLIPLFKVFMTPDVENFLSPVLHSGYIGEGQVSASFEHRFGQFIGNENVAVVNSGTSALILALRLAGVEPRDWVISTPMTPYPTNMAILSTGAGIIWGDILPDGTLDPVSVERVIGEGRWSLPHRSPKAIMCVDLGGTPCKIDDLRQFGLPVIEDACQSIGSLYKGNPVGSAADYTCFSFQAIKYLTTGDGGAVAFRDPGMVDRAKMLRWFGLDRTSPRCGQDPPEWGYKMQLNDISASIGLANLPHLSGLLQKVQGNAAYYNERFGIEPDPERRSAYWLYTIIVDDQAGFIRYMADNGVECSRVHDRNDKKQVFKGMESLLPGVDYFDSHYVCIPVGWWLSDSEVEKIASLTLSWKEKENAEPYD